MKSLVLKPAFNESVVSSLPMGFISGRKKGLLNTLNRITLKSQELFGFAGL
jgi:hypothetical protein